MAGEILLAYVRARSALRRDPIAVAVADARTRRTARTPSRLVADDLGEARSLGHAVTRMLRMLPGDTRCLTQALVLTRLLAGRDIPAKLVIGSRTTPGFVAHAWVEYAGQPVIFAGDGLFDKLVEL